MSVPKDKVLLEKINIEARRSSPSSLTPAELTARPRAGGSARTKAAKDKREGKGKKAESGDSQAAAVFLEPTEKMIIGGETGLGVPNSKHYPCLFCGADTWLAPASQSILKAEHAAVICLPCYLTNPQIPVGETFTTAAGRQELVEALGEDIAEHCLTQGVELIRAAKRKRTPEPWKV